MHDQNVGGDIKLVLGAPNQLQGMYTPPAWIKIVPMKHFVLWGTKY